jgi:hypothetical protein
LLSRSARDRSARRGPRRVAFVSPTVAGARNEAFLAGVS